MRLILSLLRGHFSQSFILPVFGSLVLLEVLIVRKNVVLFSLNNGLHDLTAVVSLFLDDIINHVHYFRLERGEAHEDFVDDVVSHEFQVCIDILHEVKRGLSQFLQLGCQEVDKQVDGRESRNVNTFKVHDGLLNHHICVFLRRVERFQI